MTTLENLIQAGDNGYIWNDKFRLRYIKSQKIPYLNQSNAIFGSEVILIDRSCPSDAYIKNIDSVTLEEFDELEYNQKYLKNKNAEAYDEDKENQLSGDYDLMGNPLKVTFLTKSMLDEAEINAAFQIDYGDRAKQRFSLECNPLNICDAMRLASEISEMSIKNTSPFGISFEGIPSWLVVDGHDKEHHLMLGVKHNTKSHTTYTTKLFGCGRQIVNRLDSLFSQISALSGSKNSKYRIRRVAQCVYDVFNLQSADNKEADFISASFSVYAKWILDKTEYLTRPPATTPVTIRFAPGWMDSRLSLHERSIERMTEWLCEQKTLWPSVGIQHEILDKVGSLIESEQMAKSTHSENDYDFTEKLWDILKECTSAETLSRSFKLIFDKLCNDFSAMVRSDNVSSLAKWLRTSRKEDLALPRLEPLTCVQLLTEIGVDRLKRDITTDFLENRLIQSVTDLQPFFKPNSMSVEERATALLPIHLSLQYMTQIELHITLQPHEKIDITRRVIQRFCSTTLEDPRTEQFSFDVTIGAVSDRVLTPDTLSDWSLDCGYYDGDKERVRALVHFATQVDFEHFASKMKATRLMEKLDTEFGEVNETMEGLELVDLYYCTVTLASILPSGGIFTNAK